MVSPTAWNLDELRDWVRASRADSEDILDFISSIDRSVRIFVYHMASARDAMTWVQSEMEVEANAMRLLFGASEKQKDFEQAKIVSEAHIISCLYTARGLWDLFAQLLNALVIAEPLPIHRCDIGRVAKALRPSPLRDAVSSAVASHWYSYVMAFTNTTKHRRLVRHLVSISMEQKRSGVKLAGFTYGRRSFPAYWDTDVLLGAIEVKNGIVACGRLLNAAIKR